MSEEDHPTRRPEDPRSELASSEGPTSPRAPSSNDDGEETVEQEENAGGILAWFARNRVAANILMVLLLLGGVLTLLVVAKEEVFPEVEIEQVMINVPYPGASPAEVEQGVILAIEEAVRGLDGIKEVRSTASEGVAVIAVELLTGADKDRALNDVKSAVDRVTSLPEDTERPVIALATNRQEVITLVLHGDVSDHVLHDLAEQVRFALLEKEEITYVEIDGTPPLEISVEVPQAELREHNLTLGQIAGAIRSASVEIPGGGVKTRAGEVLLRTDERRERGHEFEDIVLRSRPDGSSLQVGDVADVVDGFQEVDQEAFFNGERAVRVQVFRTGDQGPIEVSRAVREYVDELNGDRVDADGERVGLDSDDGERLAATLPPGITATTWSDRAEIYRDRIDLLQRNAMIGLVLVLLILSLFLEPRLAFWVTLGIPISFAGSVLFLPAVDVSINMISLFAFIVTLGMVVDDAIVVGEAIYEKRAEGLPFSTAAVRGVREVARPVIFSITTTCIFFAPMLFVPGVSGKFFRNIPVVVISVLLISLVESLLILPAHLSHKMPWWMRVLLAPLLFPMTLAHRIQADRGLAWFIRKAYRPALRVAMSWRYLTIATGMAVALVTCSLIPSGRLKTNFMPKVEGDVITAQLRMPVGTAFQDTDRIQEHMVETAQRLVEEHGGTRILRGLYSTVGKGGGFSGGPTRGAAGAGSHLASVMVYLVQSDQRDVRTTDFANEWREAIGEVVGAEALTFSYSIGANAGSPIDVRLSHPDAEVLEGAAETLARGLRDYIGLRDIDSGVSPGKEQIDLRLTGEGRARGLTETELARQIRAAFYGAEALRQQRGREEIRVYVRRPRSERASLHELERLIVRTPDGGEMPLGQAADLAYGRAYTSIQRVDGRRVISVTADLVPGVGNATEVVRSLEGERLPALLADVPGLSYEFGGEQKERARSLSSLGWGLLFAIIVMLGLLAIAFRSYLQPLVVAIAIPLGVAGGLLGHLLMGFEVSIISAMGLLALSGVVVNDSLILVDAVNNLRSGGMSLWEAVCEGGARRFRPILLTSLTTFFGLVPMILEPSVQARFLVPMAISLGFGVLFATVILVLVVPATYLVIEDLKRGARRTFGKLGRAYEGEYDRERNPSPAE